MLGNLNDIKNIGLKGVDIYGLRNMINPIYFKIKE